MGHLSLELIQLWDPGSGSPWSTLAGGRWIPFSLLPTLWPANWELDMPLRGRVGCCVLLTRSWSSRLSSLLVPRPMAQGGSCCLWCLGSSPLAERLLTRPRHVSHPWLLLSCLFHSHSPCSAPSHPVPFLSWIPVGNDSPSVSDILGWRDRPWELCPPLQKSALPPWLSPLACQGLLGHHSAMVWLPDAAGGGNLALDS